MAAIFQIRRGSGSVSLLDGELYLHKSSGSIQFSLGDGNPILLARLDQPNSGSIDLSGNITASNALFTGDVSVNGNLFLGNQTTDNINVGGEFTSDLLPNPTNTYNLGSTDKLWKNVYATSFSGSFSGSINGIHEGISAFSTSANSRLSNLEADSGSQNARITTLENKATTLQTYTASVDGHIVNINTKTGSFENKFNTLQTYTASLNGHISDINLYTASLKAALDVTGGNTRILGNLIVDGIQTSLNTTETYIEDKSITLASGSATSAIADGAGLNIAGANVSMSWDDANSRLYFNTNISALGSISSSTIVGLNGASVNVYSTSVDSRLTNLQSTSASINGHIIDINTKTGSFENKFNTLQSYTASVDSKFTTLQSLTASYSSSIGYINQFTASNGNTSLNEYTQSNSAKWTTLQSLTASYDSSITQLNSATASLFISASQLTASVTQLRSDFTALATSVDPNNIAGHITAINAWTASTSLDLARIHEATASLNVFTASNGNTSLNAFTASNDNTSLNTYTASLKNAITVSGTDVSIAGNLSVLGTTTIIDTTTLAIKDNIIELNAGGGVNGGLVVRDVTGTTTSGSLLWDTTNDYWIAGPLGAESKLLRAGGDGIISSSTQIPSLLPAGVVSGSSQITFGGISSLPTLVSASSQINFTQLSGISNGIVSSSSQITPLLPIGVVSGSSQINYTSITGISSGIISGSSQIIPLLPTGVVSGSSQITAGSTTNFSTDVKTQLNNNTVVSGSSQITLSSTTGGSTTSNVQFGSLGIGTAASGVTGEIRATADITAYYSSDSRLKENIIPIPNALEKVNQISGNTYDWKEGYDEVHSHKGNDVGVIAQEIEQILPQIVTNRDSGYKAVQYEKIIPLLIEAIKELSAKVDRLEKK